MEALILKRFCLLAPSESGFDILRSKHNDLPRLVSFFHPFKGGADVIPSECFGDIRTNLLCFYPSHHFFKGSETAHGGTEQLQLAEVKVSQIDMAFMS